MNRDNVAIVDVPHRAYTTDGEPATPTACRETYDGGSTYKGRGNCGVPHYVYGETGKVLTKKDVTGEATDERYAAADQFLLEEGARSSFLTILAHDLMEENKIEMPLNMPFTTRVPVSNFKLCFNLRFVDVVVRCYSLNTVSRRSWPSLETHGSMSTQAASLQR